MLCCTVMPRSEEHTSELQSLTNLVCRLLLEKNKPTSNNKILPPLGAARRARTLRPARPQARRWRHRHELHPGHERGPEQHPVCFFFNETGPPQNHPLPPPPPLPK